MMNTTKVTTAPTFSARVSPASPKVDHKGANELRLRLASRTLNSMSTATFVNSTGFDAAPGKVPANQLARRVARRRNSRAATIFAE